MRFRRLRRFVPIAYLLLAACSDGLGPGEQLVTFEVASSTVTSRDFSGAAIQCIQVRERSDAPWTALCDSIEGFVYEPGFRYAIRVAKRVLLNPPQDSSNIAYRLLEILSKVPEEAKTAGIGR